MQSYRKKRPVSLSAIKINWGCLSMGGSCQGEKCYASEREYAFFI